jgi:hypothetical protein
MTTLKNMGLDVLEEKSEHEEDGDKLTREGFYKSNSTLDSVAMNRPRKY